MVAATTWTRDAATGKFSTSVLSPQKEIETMKITDNYMRLNAEKRVRPSTTGLSRIAGRQRSDSFRHIRECHRIPPHLADTSLSRSRYLHRWSADELRRVAAPIPHPNPCLLHGILRRSSMRCWRASSLQLAYELQTTYQGRYG